MNPAGGGSFQVRPPPRRKEIVLSFEVFVGGTPPISRCTSIKLRHDEEMLAYSPCSWRETGGEPVYLRRFCKLESVCALGWWRRQHDLSIKLQDQQIAMRCRHTRRLVGGKQEGSRCVCVATANLKVCAHLAGAEESKTFQLNYKMSR